MKKVLCVCLGNTCRSPMMEAMLRHELSVRGVEVQVESAGLLKEAEGQDAFTSSVMEMRDRGLDISGHKSRHVGSIGELTQFDLIICVGRSEADRVVALEPTLADRVMVANEVNGGIPNPWEKGDEAYRTCALTIVSVMGEMAEDLSSQWK